MVLGQNTRTQLLYKALPCVSKKLNDLNIFKYTYSAKRITNSSNYVPSSNVAHVKCVVAVPNDHHRFQMPVSAVAVILKVLLDASRIPYTLMAIVNLVNIHGKWQS